MAKKHKVKRIEEFDISWTMALFPALYIPVQAQLIHCEDNLIQ